MRPMRRPRSNADAEYFAREMRRDMTISERAAWNELRGRKLGVKFRRQVVIGPYILDFACFVPRIAIEIDDPSHEFRDETIRTSYIESQGFVMLRFTNEFVAKHGVGESVANWLEQNHGIRRPWR